MAVRKGEASAGTGRHVLFFTGDITVSGTYQAEEHEDGTIVLTPAAGSLARLRSIPLPGHGVLEQEPDPFPFPFPFKEPKGD